MPYLRFIKLINRTLIQSYDRNQLIYMLLVFPIYQALAVLAMASVIYLATVSTVPYAPIVAGVLGTIIAVPILASWYLSCFLCAHGYFDLLKGLGLPTDPVLRFLEYLIKPFRLSLS